METSEVDPDRLEERHGDRSRHKGDPMIIDVGKGFGTAGAEDDTSDDAKSQEEGTEAWMLGTSGKE